MKKFHTNLTLFLVFVFSVYCFGQNKTTTRNLPNFGVHAGALSYIGDVKGSEGSTLFTHWKAGYGFYLEKKLGNVFGVSINGLFGKVAKSQLDEKVFQNFQTSIMNVDLNVLLDFDNGKIINQSSVFSPYLSIGFGFLSFNPKGDLKNSSGNYYHWNDGTLRDISQDSLGSDTSSNIMLRDYTYESDLKDSVNNYSKTSFTLPLRVGFKFKMSPNVDVRIGVAYIITFTDYLDNIKGGGNDNMFYTSFGLQYNFAISNADDKYTDFDFSQLDKIDADGDGVNDVNDLCQNTPKGVKVDGSGCPLDGDKDGVPDYLDKELNTLPGKTVNSDGVTLTDEMITQKTLLKDSVQTERRYFKAEDLSKVDITAIQREYELANNTSVNTISIPSKYQALDLDKDDYISAKEVTNAIDDFFDGKNNLTAKDLHQLIDFYFDQ